MPYFLKIINFLTLVFLGLSSCNKDYDPNEKFNKKYGQQIMHRKMPENKKTFYDLKKEAPRPFQPITSEEVYLDSIKRQVQYFPYSKINRFGQRFDGGYLDRAQALSQSVINSSSQRISSDVFDIVYFAGPYESFDYKGARFDGIRIPIRDRYGVETSFANKEYLNPGNNALQKSVESFNKNRGEDSIAMTEILIREQKDLRKKQKMIDIFGYEDYAMRQEEFSSSKQEDKNIASNNSKKDVDINKVEEKTDKEKVARDASGLQNQGDSVAASTANLNNKQSIPNISINDTVQDKEIASEGGAIGNNIKEK